MRSREWGIVLRKGKTKGDLSPREVEAAWRRKLIDRLAGIEIETPSQFDTQLPGGAVLGSNRQRSAPLQPRSLRDVIKPSLVARGIRNDIQKLTGARRSGATKRTGASRGVQMFAVSLSSAVLTGLIWVSAYAVISDSAPGITTPIEAAVAALFAPEQTNPAPPRVASANLASTPVELAILDNDADLAPAKPNAVADAEAFPTPGVPSASFAASPATLSPIVEPAPEPVAAVKAPVTSAAIAPAVPVAGVAVVTAKATPGAATKATPRDTVLAMMKSTEDTIANTIGRIDPKTAPLAQAKAPAPLAAAAPLGIRIATVRTRIRTRVTRSVASDGGVADLSQGRMALGAPSATTQLPGVVAKSANNIVPPEVLPWRKKAAAAMPEVLPWQKAQPKPAQTTKAATVRKGRFKTKVYRAASADSSVAMPTPGQMAFVAPKQAPSRKKGGRVGAKPTDFLDTLLKGLDELTTVSSKRN